MCNLSVHLSKPLHKNLNELAKKEGVSMNQLINLAVSEKLSALLTVDYLKVKERAEKGSRREFEKIMENVPDVEPEEYDIL